MSDIAIGKASADNGIFRGVTIILMLVIGLMGFAGMILLGAYAPDLRSGRNGGAHALSNAVTGYSGLVQLAEATGRHPRILRSTHDFDTEDLLIVTPESGATDISAALNGRETKPTLFVLPKWQTMPDETHPGWARFTGLIPLHEPIGVLSPGVRFTMQRYRTGGGWLTSHDPDVRFWAPRPIQVITGIEQDNKNQDDAWRRLTPILTDERGNMVLVRVGDGPLYVLADPDLLNNRGMKDEGQAAAALGLLDWMNSTGAQSVAFDVSMNGFGHSKSPLKLLFDPPFLAMTLAIVAALALAGVHAFGRFGPPRARQRALAFGKAALIDNSALLIRKAGREARLGGRYAAAIRDRAARIFAVPARLRDGEIDDYLDSLKGQRRFTDLAQAAEAATDRHGLLEAAQALHDWQEEKNR
ncbi:hypothetical protein PMI04_018305 [Sphingobium sp. AP49]|uniref:DUF4350 domain-containing protein n=1 Tax=Sphingobium sp. AP49 TaxID=1144307 RepID=UPI00026EE17C|nr:DUF4350 domain-containing protein [Sphingobium sp. AP49]WHO38474.1 hypothetical protein PMI04_018305 [Sphingobium sp. AP49]